MKDRYLDAKGEGEYSYDFKNDVMIFRIRDRDYSRSIDFGNLIIDLDTEDFVTGLRVMDASEMFKLSKLMLRSIQNFEFSSQVEDNVVHIQLKFETVFRNKTAAIHGQDFIREVMESNITDSKVVCSVA